MEGLGIVSWIIVGALVGGFLYGAFAGRRLIYGWNLGSFVVAIIGRRGSR